MRNAGDDRGAVAPSPATMSRRVALAGLIGAGAAMPVATVAAPVGGDDDLIRLCRRLIDVDAESRAIVGACHSLADERAAAPRVDQLNVEHRDLMDCLAGLPDPLPRTRAGITMMARAAVALMPLDVDGRPDSEGQDPDAYLALAVAQAIVAGEAGAA